MELEQVKKFVELVKGTDIEELHWEKEGTKIAFKREHATVTPSTAGQSTSTGTQTGSVDNTRTEPGGKKMVSLKSPMVGTFYRSLPERPPLVLEGDHVTPGRKIAVIETMKIMKDVTSTVKGKIAKIFIENGKPVEYGQELFLIEPTEENGEIGINKEVK